MICWTLSRGYRISNRSQYPYRRSLSREDAQALEKLDKETVLLSDRYQVPMLWKDESVMLPYNLTLAMQRFSLLMKRLKVDEDL